MNQVLNTAVGVPPTLAGRHQNKVVGGAIVVQPSGVSLVVVT